MNGKTVVITGGTRGIGLATAETFARDKANVVITFNNNEDIAQQAESHLKSISENVLIIKADVTDLEAAKKVVSMSKDEFGSVDVLVNNAGITKDNLIMRMKESDFDSVVQTNLTGAFNMIKAVTPVMLKQKSGRIINITSIAGLRGNPGQINYSASKAGLVGMTYSAAKELGSRGITVNAVAPGYIKTAMTDALTDDQKKGLLDVIDLQRLGEPEDVANTIKFLASDDASYITGQVISVDGGMNI